MGKLNWGFLRLGGGTAGAEVARLRLIVESAPNAIVLIDRDGRITLVNAQMERLFGYTRQELIGQQVEVLIPARFRASHPGHRTGFFANPGPRAMGAGRDLFGLRKDGYEFPIEIGLSPIASRGELSVMASIIDVTARKQAEERFRRVVESVPNAIVLADAAGLITLINAQTERMFGYTRDELIGKPVETLLPERYRAKHPALRTSYAAHPDTRAMGAGRDLFGLCKDGREIPIEIGLNPIEAEQGRLVLASIIDISERKRAETQVNSLIRETRDTAEVLASSVGEILAGTSQIAAGAEETSASVEETAITVEQVKQTVLVSSQKASEMSEMAQRASQISRGGKQAVEDAIDGMQRIHDQMEMIAESIVQLSEQTQTIGEIIATVNDLAEQSNLLAVNASIEAAKAGEQGRGFAVVAQEVKSLAEQSKQATVQVRSILSDIQRATSRAVLATEQGSKAVDAGVAQSTGAGEAIQQLSDSIDLSAQAATQIAASAQQQLIGIGQLALAMENIRTAASQNRISTKQSESAAQSLHDLGQRLKATLAQFRV